jgi:hypothetical protein
MPETLLSPSNVLLYGRVVEDLQITQPNHNPFIAGARRRGGPNRELADQLADEEAVFARIYGFSWEGTYYELPQPALFLVHGPGENVTPASPDRKGTLVNQARAPGDPSVSGMVATDIQFSDDVKVWSYDKADQTIRMDTEAGEFEDVLLAPFFNGGVSGARVAGARVSGARVSGARVSGARLSGARVTGGRDSD